jgi:putative membrane protein
MSSDTFYGERLHPVGMVIVGVSVLRANLIPVAVIAGISAARGGFEAGDLLRTVPLLVLVALFAGAAGAVSWATTFLSLSPEALSLRTGLMSKKETTVPLERVQALDELTGPLHRLFGLVRVDVQTAGGGTGGEISLSAVDRETLGMLRRAVSLPVAEPGPSRRLGGGRLLVAALTSGSLGVLLPVVAFLPQVLDELLAGDVPAGDAGALLGLAPDSAAEWLTIAAVVLGVAWLLSALGVIVAFAGFSVERVGDRLLIRRGLFQRRTATVPAARVQAIRVVEGVLRQPLGFASVRVEVAGYASEAAAAQTLFPLLRPGDVPSLLRELLPEMPGALGPLRPAPPRALRRYVLPPALSATVVGAALWPVLDSPLALALVLPAALLGVLAHRAAGFRLEDGAIAIRFRRIARTTIVGPARLTQRHSVSQSPLQRRARLADFAITLGAGGDARVRHLEEADAWAAFGGVTVS